VFDKKVLRKIFRPCKDDQSREWKKRHIQQLHELFQRSNNTKKMSVERLKWAGYV